MHDLFMYYCNALLAYVPASIIKPLQMIQKAAARLVFNQPKRSHITALLVVSIIFKAQKVAYRTTYRSARSYLNTLQNV